MPLGKIQDFNALIDSKPFSDQLVKNKQEAYWHVKKWSLYTGNLLDYLYHQIYYALIDIDLSRETNISIPRITNFTRNLEEDGGATVFITKNQQKNILNFSLDSLIVTE